MTLALAPPAPLLQAVQSIGNLGQQLGQGKEMWMAPLHPFLLQSISRVRDFLDQLVDVDGEEGEFLWPCHIWLITPLDRGDLPFLFPPPPRSTETVGQLVSQLTFSAPNCAFPANAEMWMGTGAWYSCNRQISIKCLLWVFWFCLLGLGGGVQLLRGLKRRLLQLKDLLQDPGFLALFPLPELPAKCSPRALGKAP